MTPPEIAAALRLARLLREMAAKMQRVGVDIEYFSGFGAGETARYGRQLVGAAAVALEWAAEIEKDAGT